MKLICFLNTSLDMYILIEIIGFIATLIFLYAVFRIKKIYLISFITGMVSVTIMELVNERIFLGTFYPNSLAYLPKTHIPLVMIFYGAIYATSISLINIKIFKHIYSKYKYVFLFITFFLLLTTSFLVEFTGLYIEYWKPLFDINSIKIYYYLSGVYFFYFCCTFPAQIVTFILFRRRISAEEKP